MFCVPEFMFVQQFIKVTDKLIQDAQILLATVVRLIIQLVKVHQVRK